MLAGVEVRAINRDAGAAAGYLGRQYQIPFLVPGFCSVSAEMAGFKKFVREGIEVRVAETSEVNMALELGAVSEVIEVKAETPLLATADASQGTVVEGSTVVELPLQGGNPIEFALLDPAIMNETDMRERRASMTNASSSFSAMGTGAFTNEFPDRWRVEYIRRG